MTTIWKKELKNKIVTSASKLEGILDFTHENFVKNVDFNSKFKLKAPANFIAKIEKNNLQDPLLKQILPTVTEKISVAGYSRNPLDEDEFLKAPGLIHKYKNRVLLIISSACVINCRYCFRKEFPYNNNILGKRDLSTALEYIANNKNINEVIFSGGDPLIASDEHLYNIAKAIEKILHVTTLRIHTRIPIVMPSRITKEFVKLLQKLRLNVVMVVHSNHPNEIDNHVKRKAQLMIRNGILLFNQSVLLKGVNDDVKVLKELSEKLFAAKILPYYLHLLDKVVGSHHFYVSNSKAKKIYQELQGELSGYLLPKLTIEKPGSASKTIISS